MAEGCPGLIPGVEIGHKKYGARWKRNSLIFIFRNWWEWFWVILKYFTWREFELCSVCSFFLFNSFKDDFRTEMLFQNREFKMLLRKCFKTTVLAFPEIYLYIYLYVILFNLVWNFYSCLKLCQIELEFLYGFSQNSILPLIHC